jgi:hypothetical protein
MSYLRTLDELEEFVGIEITSKGALSRNESRLFEHSIPEQLNKLSMGEAA